MKKLIILVSFLFIFALASYGKGGNGKVISVKGKAFLLKYSQSYKKMRLTVGTTVKPQDIILTTKTGKAKVRLADGSTVVIKQNSRIHFSFVSKKSQRIQVGKGGILSKVNKLRVRKGFSVNTPTSVAGVRGTKFVTEYNENSQENNINVYEGKVSFSHDSVSQESASKNVKGKIVIGRAININRHHVSLSNGKSISFSGSKTTVGKVDNALLKKYENLITDENDVVNGWEFN